jgi:hypothetical protein
VHRGTDIDQFLTELLDPHSRPRGALCLCSRRRRFPSRIPRRRRSASLLGAGRFTTPPAPVQEGSYVRFPTWCESRYLARVASQAPEAVAKIIRKIPATTNVRVHEDYVDAALAMPPAIAVKLVAQAKTWAESPYPTLLPDTLGKLIVHLAQGGITHQAIGLAKTHLALQPDPRADEKAKHKLSQEPRARFDSWDYEEILREGIAPLVMAAGLPALDMLVDLLDAALSLSHEGHTGPEDLTFIWRPAIEDHSQNYSSGLRPREALIVAVRDAAENLVADEPSFTEEVVSHLEAHRWHVFGRIILHLLRLYAPNPALADKYIADPVMFGTGAYHHEYVLLAKEAFPSLSGSDQEQILTWGDTGPDIERFRTRYVSETRSPPTEEIIADYVRHWRSRQFNSFRDAIPTRLVQRHPWLEDLEAATEDDQFSMPMHTWIGPTSPLTLDELEQMPDDRLLDYLRTWTPQEEMMAPSASGLARVITEAAARSPERFASNSTQWIGLNEACLSGVLQGLNKALQGGRPFSWDSVLELCAAIVKDTISSEGPNVDHPSAPRSRRSSSIRLSIGWLLERGLRSGDQTMQIPFEHRHLVWSILRSLANDPDPSPPEEDEHALRQNGTGRQPFWDPTSLAINSVRGMALHAIIYYALWVRKHLELKADKPIRSRTFAQMPEVSRVLERHLSVTSDPSLAIRSSYGQHLGAPAYLAPNWVIKSPSRIFPEEPSLRQYRDAAWRAFIRYSQPQAAIFQLLRAQYGWAVKTLPDQANDDAANSEGAEARLGMHLIVFYWHGVLDLEPDGLLERYFDRASASLCASTLDYVGHSLRQSGQYPDQVGSEVVERLTKLWEWRMAAVKASASIGDRRGELSAFGDWFAFGSFTDEWALEWLLWILQQGSRCGQRHLCLIVSR